LTSKRKKRITSPVNNEPQEVPDSESDTPYVRKPTKGTSSRAVVVDSPSPKKKRAPKKTAPAKIFKSNEFILDEVDDDEPPAKTREIEDDGEDENMYDDSFINDGSSDVHVGSPNTRHGKSHGKCKEKATSRTTVPGAAKRKKTSRSDEALSTIIDDDEQDEFVPDTEDEIEQAPRSRSTRKGKQRQVDQEMEESVVPVYPMDVGYSDGPDDEGEQTEPEAAPRPDIKKPRNARLAAIANEEGYGSTSHDEEYNSADDDLVDLTEEDPFDMGVIDVDLYDDAPSQRFRDFEADYGQVKLEKGISNADGNADGADEFDDITFDQSFMDNLDDFDFQDQGDNLNTNTTGAAQPMGTTYTRAAAGNYDEVDSEEDDDAERFVPISALSAGDRDFFLNHWRRSAMDATGLQGSEKQLAESRQQAARGTANPRSRGRGGRGGGGKWRGGRGGWRGRK
jgi:hypothetical protein